MTRLLELRPGLSLIDLNFQGQPGVIAAYLVEDAGEYALVEVGPSSTLDALFEGIRAAGVTPGEISKLIVTHIHLDHAGAAGTLVRAYPHLQVYVHEIGARHLEDPSRLLVSAGRIYGDRMDRLWGEVVPVPSANLNALSDGEQVDIGDLHLAAWHTPGHASHHIAYFDADHLEVFTGDVAAIRLQGFDYVRPATPPPDVDLELWDASLNRLGALQARAFHLTHFGSFTDVDYHLDSARKQLSSWARLVTDMQAHGHNPEQIKVMLQDHADAEVMLAHNSPEAKRQYDLAAPTGMSVDGLLRYLRRQPSTPSY